MIELNNTEQKELHAALIDLLKIFRDVCDEENIWYSLAFGTMLGAVREKNIIQWDTDVDVFILKSDTEKLRNAFVERNFDCIEYINYDTTFRCLKSHDALVSTCTNLFSDIHLDIYPIVGAPAKEKEQNRIACRWSYLDRIIRSKYVDITQCKPKNKILVVFAKIVDYCIPDKVLRANIKKREAKYDMKKTGYWMTLVNYGSGRSCFPISYLEGFDEKELSGEKYKVLKEWDRYLNKVYGDYMTPKKY